MKRLRIVQVLLGVLAGVLFTHAGWWNSYIPEPKNSIVAMVALGLLCIVGIVVIGADE